jgi:hypothetical protein
MFALTQKQRKIETGKKYNSVNEKTQQVTDSWW